MNNEIYRVIAKMILLAFSQNRDAAELFVRREWCKWKRESNEAKFWLEIAERIRNHEEAT